MRIYILPKTWRLILNRISVLNRQILRNCDRTFSLTLLQVHAIIGPRWNILTKSIVRTDKVIATKIYRFSPADRKIEIATLVIPVSQARWSTRAPWWHMAWLSLYLASKEKFRLRIGYAAETTAPHRRGCSNPCYPRGIGEEIRLRWRRTRSPLRTSTHSQLSNWSLFLWNRLTMSWSCLPALFPLGEIRYRESTFQKQE